ncbi:hypothetical protein, partial [Enterobacter hormaechei]|uniref:hypothetical protein n=1 Tax=Enterobacter hormaechei TaxID=158836 RepID=UPI0020410197
GGTADRNRSHWSTSKTPSYTKSVSWQHHPDFYLYSVTGKSINYEWKQYEINGIKLEQYISGENDLFVYEHKYGFFI